jgi:hypothetical protein
MNGACQPMAMADAAALPAPPEREITSALSPDDQDDPGYTAYKEGYRLILDEQWEAARKKLTEVLSRFKQSRYRDDAEYWSAYALKHLDRKKAIKAYEDFLRQHPRSRYLDDVVADLAELQARAPMVAGNPDSVIILEGHEMPGIAQVMGMDIRGLSLNIRRMERVMRHELLSERMGQVAPVPFFVEEETEHQPLDRTTRLKINAIRALSQISDDPQSYSTLKEIALDTRQPQQVRSVALTSLANFKDADLLPVLVQVAENDTDAAIQG